RAVDEFDQLRPAVDQVEQVGLDTIDVEVADADLDARQAELAAERTAPARLEIGDAVAQTSNILGKSVRRRDRVQIKLGPTRVQERLRLTSFPVSETEHEMVLTLPSNLPQQVPERLLAFAHHNEVDRGQAFHPVRGIVGHLGAAEYDL